MNGHISRMLLIVVVGGALVLLPGCALLDLLRPPPEVPPEAPGQVQATLGELEHEVRVSWGAVEGAEYYQVYRAPAQDGEYQPIGSSDSPEYLDQPSESHQLTMGTLYWYRVRACNQAGCSDLSAPVFGYAGYPPPPEGIQATDGAYPNKIVVTWDPVPGATGYQVYRDTAENGTYPRQVGQPNESSVEDHAVSPGTLYWYRVRACNLWGCSPLSPDRDSGCVAPCPVP